MIEGLGLGGLDLFCATYSVLRNKVDTSKTIIVINSQTLEIENIQCFTYLLIIT